MQVRGFKAEVSLAPRQVCLVHDKLRRTHAAQGWGQLPMAEIYIVLYSPLQHCTANTSMHIFAELKQVNRNVYAQCFR